MATLPTWKILLISVSVILLSSCGRHVWKVYDLQPAKGLVRKQDNEVLPFAKAVGYLCASKKDTGNIVACTAGGVKVYMMKATHLVRKQANETKSFESAAGFQCVSPSTMEGILSQCAK